MAEQEKKPAASITGIGRPNGPGMNARAKVEKPHNTSSTIKRLFLYIGKSHVTLFFMLFLMFIITSIDVIGPFFQQKAIDTISWQNNTLEVDFHTMLHYLFLIGLIFLISAFLNFFQGLLAAKLSQNTVYALRGELFHKISRLPIQYIDTHEHGDLMSRMTNDTDNISNAVTQSISTLCQAVLTLIGVFIMMLYYSPLLTAIAIVTIPITIYVSNMLSRFMRKYFKTQQILLGHLNGQVEEMITSYRTVVAYGKEDSAVNDFASTSDALRKCSIKARVWGSIMGPIMNFLGNFQYVLIASVGGYLILTGQSSLTIGSIQAMLQYSKKFSQPINMIANQYSTILTALAGAERIFDILDGKDEIDEGSLPLLPEKVKGNIEFQNLHFGYKPDHEVLKNLNLSVKQGEKIALVGATGSGKTTIVNLLTRFYELDAGKITIDGIDITQIPKANLRSLIAIVLQDTVLFNTTIEENIKYGNLNASLETIKSSAETAMASHFIERLPDQYKTVLTEAGANLSEGQRQLLAIARAVLANPKILILDEATSSVDTRTEVHIQQAMMNLMQGRTSFIIAHRLSTIRDADQIVVIHNGQIVESGNHNELLSLHGEYYNLYQKQIAGSAT